jgi:hypothetical protein
VEREEQEELEEVEQDLQMQLRHQEQLTLEVVVEVADYLLQYNLKQEELEDQV